MESNTKLPPSIISYNYSSLWAYIFLAKSVKKGLVLKCYSIFGYHFRIDLSYLIKEHQLNFNFETDKDLKQKRSPENLQDENLINMEGILHV